MYGQILLHTCPKKLRDLLRKEEIPPPGQCPVLVMELEGGAEVPFSVCSSLLATLLMSQ